MKNRSCLAFLGQRYERLDGGEKTSYSINKAKNKLAKINNISINLKSKL